MQMLPKKYLIYKTILSFLIFNFSFLISTAQWYDPEKINKKAGEIYGQAIEEAQNRNFAVSIKYLNEALALDPKFVDVFLTRSNVYAELKDYTASVADFETAMRMDSVYSKVYLLPYSISLAGAGKFEQALKAVNEFLATPSLNLQSIKAGNYRKSVYTFALDYETKHPAKDYVFAPVNLGNNINTKDLEYFPSLTIDGTKMIFNRRIAGDEDFYESNFIDGKWNKAEPLGGKVNTSC
jgi:tetratricopeptide (TPR) repeat protein